MGINGDAVKSRQIFLVQVSQLFFNIHIAIEIDIAVAGMIVTLMEVLEHLISELRNRLGVTAGLIAIGCVRIERSHNTAFQ